MNGGTANIETAFLKMSEIGGFEGILFLSTKGKVLASRFTEGAASPGTDAWIADCLKDVDAFARQVGSQGLAELTVKGRLRTLMLVRSSRADFLTVVLGREDMHLALAKLKMKETADEVERTLDGLLKGTDEA
jgi:predicted regulator of Ras-like GTPase activity (Roadblock/LC7/MglB family)